jgi:hypothetical protein
MKSIQRRVFLTRGSVVVAAAGVAAAAPGLVPGLVEAAGATTTTSTTTEPPVEVTLDEPLVVHVRDLATGEIGLFSGTQEIVVHDRHLASLLVQAAR